jgi:glycosyltransferase involved in cell wall biosynthesis
MTKILIIVADSQYFISHRLVLSQYLKENGYEIHIAAQFVSVKDIKKLKKECFILHELPTRPATFGFFYSGKIVLKVRDICRDIKPKIILSVSIRMSLLSMISAFLSSGQVKHYSLITGMGSLVTSNKKSFKVVEKLIKLLIKIISKSKKFHIIVQNQDDHNIFKSLISCNRLSVVHGSGVDHRTYVRCNEKSTNEIIVTMVSRVLKDKGVCEFFEAARVIKNLGLKNIKFQLVGDVYTANPNSLKKSTLLSWHDSGYINWLGARSDIATIYQNSDIAVLPSYREGLPKSLIEAAACGLPIVSTDVPGCREICIHGVNGLLVPAMDFNSLAQAILTLAEDEKLRETMGTKGRNLVEEMFNMDVINEKMYNLISL